MKGQTIQLIIVWIVLITILYLVFLPVESRGIFTTDFGGLGI